MSVNAEINGKSVSCVLDTGASRSVMSPQQAQKLQFASNGEIQIVRLADGSEVESDMTVATQTIVSSHVANISFLLIKGSETLLGVDWFEATGATIDPRHQHIVFPKDSVFVDGANVEKIEQVLLTELAEEDEFSEAWEEKALQPDINPALDEDTRNKALDLIHENSDVFACNYKQLGVCNIDTFRVSTSESKPIFQQPYRKSYAQRQLIKAEVDKMLEANVIRPSRSPWSAPVVLIP